MWTRGLRKCACGGEAAPRGVRARIALCSSGCINVFCKVEQQQNTSLVAPEMLSPEKSCVGLTPAWWRKRSHAKAGGRCLGAETGCGVGVSVGAPNLGFHFRV